MCCVSQLKRWPRRRMVLASPWLSALAVLLFLLGYFYSSGYRAEQSVLPRPLPPVSKEGGSLPDTGAADADTTPMAPGGRPAGAGATGPAVKLRQGTYIGTTLLANPRFPKSVDAFRGIPYARDTGGQNRFRPPQPLPDSSETFDAVEWGKICPADGVVQRNMSENCLNLNVYRPAGLVDSDGYEKTDGEEEEREGTRKRPRLPVVVYIHGGGFNKGHGTERNMGSFVAWADTPIVAVNFNYRVGPLGFLPSDVTAREGLLNLGLRDQQMLLEWVQDNIEAFGGDAKNVTIMGLSAGAHSIGHHIIYYARSAKPAPFAKAILESGAATARAVFYPTHPRHLVQFREFLIAAGAAGVPESDIFSYLRTLPLETIVEAAQVVWDKYVDSVTWPFQPVIDGPHPLANSSQPNNNLTAVPPLIPDLPINSWRAGAHLRIPVITGYNTNEGTLFVPPGADTAAEFRAFFQTLVPALTPADLDELEALYPDPTRHPRTSPYRAVPPGKGRQWARLDAAYSHYAYICPVLQTAHFMARASPASSSSSSSGGGDRGGLGQHSNVYVYRYAATGENGTANHCDEAPVVAHDMEELAGMRGLEEVAGAMHAKWASFVVSVLGDPNARAAKNDDANNKGAAAVDWPAFVSPFDDGDDGKKRNENSDNAAAASGLVLVFGEGNDERGGGRERGVPAQVEPLSELERKACRFWWERVVLSEGLGRRAGMEEEEEEERKVKSLAGARL